MSLVTEEMRNLAGSFAPSHSTALADDYYPQILVVSLELVSQHFAGAPSRTVHELV